MAQLPPPKVGEKALEDVASSTAPALQHAAAGSRTLKVLQGARRPENLRTRAK